MRLSAVLAGLLAGSAAAGAAEPVPARIAARLDARSDEVVARSFVPAPERPVGEVRLIRRGDADVVQTLLYTKLLSRVVGEIRRKELAGWPEDPGRAEALRYVEALAAVQQRLWREVQARGPAGDRRQKLWIEFLVAPELALVAIGGFEMETRDGEVRVVAREPIVVLEPPRDWVLRDMRLIAADAFRVEGEALDALLAPLRWLHGGGALRSPGAHRNRMARVEFTANLRRHLAVSAVEVPGGTLRSVLERACAGREALRGYLLDDQGALRKHVTVFVDGRRVADCAGLSDPVGDSSEVYVFQALSGG